VVLIEEFRNSGIQGFRDLGIEGILSVLIFKVSYEI
jgi:hypothetical protein